MKEMTILKRYFNILSHYITYFILFSLTNSQEIKEFPSFPQNTQFNWLSSLNQLFTKTSLDEITFQSYDIFFNPIVNNKNIRNSINGEDIAQRLLLSQFIKNDWEIIISSYEKTSFIFDSNIRKRIYQYIDGLIKFLDKYPMDTSGHYWIANMYSKLGNIDKFIHHIKLILSVIDHELPSKCKKPSYQREIQYRNKECSDLSLFRSRIVSNTGSHLFKEARSYNESEYRLKYVSEALTLWESNYETLSRIDRRLRY